MQFYIIVKNTIMCRINENLRIIVQMGTETMIKIWYYWPFFLKFPFSNVDSIRP